MGKTAIRERITFALLAAFAVALLTFALVAHLQDTSSWDDLMGFYTAGRVFREAPQSRLYDPQVEMYYQQKTFGRVSELRVYDHTPVEILVFWPLSYLPYWAAYLSWDFLNLALLGWSLCLLKPYAGNLDTAARLILTAVIAYPLISTLREGQDSIPLLLAFSVAFVSLKKGNQIAAGCALGAGLCRFQFVLPCLLVFLARRRWRVLLGALAAGGGLGVLSVALVGWNGVRSYVKWLLTVTKYGRYYVPTIGMPNVRGFAEALLANRVGHGYLNVLVAASSFILVGWVIRKWGRADWDPGKKAFDLLFSLNLVVSLLVAYNSFMHNLILLALPVLLLLHYCAGSSRFGLARWRLVLPLILLILMTCLLNLEGGNRFTFLFMPLLWLALAISREIPPAREQAGGGGSGHC
jgi:hypothetical protein